LTFTPQISSRSYSPVQRYVFTKLEVFTAFLFLENCRHGTYGRTDRRTDRRTNGRGATHL